MEDKRDVLKEEKPFSYRMLGADKARIFYKSRAVHIAVGKDFLKLSKAVSSGDDYQLQMAMAKMTGNFKHGNER